MRPTISQIVAISAIGAGALAMPAAAHAATAGAQPFTWRLAITASAQQVHGTTYIESDTVNRNGQPFGFAMLTCPGAAQQGVSVARCTFDLAVSGGTITAALQVNNTTGAITGRVTGGSSRYAGVDGRVSGHNKGDGAALTLTVAR